MKKIDRVPLREQVVEAIRQVILTGEFQPGDKLPELDLAERLGVSRSPVREALYILEQQGLVVNRLKKGTYVVSLTPQELYDGQLLRAVIEEFAIQQAIERSQPHEWDELCANIEQLVEQMRGVSDGDRSLNMAMLEVEIHERIIEAAKNSMLSRSWHFLGLPMRVWLVKNLYHAQEEFWQATIDNHVNLLEALRSRDPEICREAIRSHIMTTEFMVQLCQEFFAEMGLDEGALSGASQVWHHSLHH